ncbi:tetratricopeptide repeat protein [Pseudanabaena sp. ABRG5-3]|uniref:tetratricopeptide repeat protein n=1 Tax=Pseudanabaena sp. ABRG5-3 TaxID=685565 RepID=UPI000DC6F837|nr:tetratricopeptide repeat protein [Pseudanabaena sp. ABRG5-3]BBC26666.1 hypothetical protein ABRG53_a092 [Pseudanabaena sp. ABRG5-3]
MASKKKTTSKSQETEDLFVQGDKDSLKAIENLEKSLEEYKKIGDSVKVADTLFEIGKIHSNLGKRFHWEAILKGVKDPRPLPPLPEPVMESPGPEEIHSIPEVPEVPEPR